MKNIFLLGVAIIMLIGCSGNSPKQVSKNKTVVTTKDGITTKKIYGEEGLVLVTPYKNGKKHGQEVRYWSGFGGVVRSKTTWKNGAKNGPYMEWRPLFEHNTWTNWLTLVSNYKNNVLDGPYVKYADASGQVEIKVYYKNGYKEGVEICYVWSNAKNNKLYWKKYTGRYKNGVIIEANGSKIHHMSKKEKQQMAKFDSWLESQLGQKTQTLSTAGTASTDMISGKCPSGFGKNYFIEKINFRGTPMYREKYTNTCMLSTVSEVRNCICK